MNDYVEQLCEKVSQRFILSNDYVSSKLLQTCIVKRTLKTSDVIREIFSLKEDLADLARTFYLTMPPIKHFNDNSPENRMRTQLIANIHTFTERTKHFIETITEWTERTVGTGGGERTVGTGGIEEGTEGGERTVGTGGIEEGTGGTGGGENIFRREKESIMKEIEYIYVFVRSFISKNTLSLPSQGEVGSTPSYHL